ncbi:hypothetical protein NDU88_002755 [Pleurodeles waltl]|uniref:Uncharacterized protein n=1 Tax=Pleurodeles waltl TaxID=8319 RepID=A0AAV7MTQ1_PLEWA|nr:hypothetical protein NDU88_002755 [Pleurodeles waltl]
MAAKLGSLPAIQAAPPLQSNCSGSEAWPHAAVRRATSGRGYGPQYRGGGQGVASWRSGGAVRLSQRHNRSERWAGHATPKEGPGWVELLAEGYRGIIGRASSLTLPSTLWSRFSREGRCFVRIAEPADPLTTLPLRAPFTSVHRRPKGPFCNHNGR